MFSLIQIFYTMMLLFSGLLDTSITERNMLNIFYFIEAEPVLSIFLLCMSWVHYYKIKVVVSPWRTEYFIMSAAFFKFALKSILFHISIAKAGFFWLVICMVLLAWYSFPFYVQLSKPLDSRPVLFKLHIDKFKKVQANNL